MISAKHWARRASLAAFTAWSTPAMADQTAKYDNSTGNVVIAGLSPENIATILAEPDAVRLRVAGSASERGMLVTLSQDEGLVVVTPSFALRPGTDFVLRVLGKTFKISLPLAETEVPSLLRFSPSQAVVPANALRFYLHFSQPMARGQLRDAVALRRGDGTMVYDPFLLLETELWDPSQTRLTLLLDPGRIKQGVGPNLAGGAPLQEGESYQLVLSGALQSGVGIPLGRDTLVSFRVGPAERRALDPKAWRILAPEPGSHAALSISFDRIMDLGAVQRLMWLESPDGRRVTGAILSDGGSWTLVPDVPWQEGVYRLVIDPALEDVSGNTLSAPFDADRGTIGKADEPATIAIEFR